MDEWNYPQSFHDKTSVRVEAEIYEDIYIFPITARTQPLQFPTTRATF